MRTQDFLFEYPPEGVAQEPLSERDASRMMVLNRSAATIADSFFREFPSYFQEGDVLVLNNTKVIPARLCAQKKSGGKIEVLLVRDLPPAPSFVRRGGKGEVWECLIRSMRGLKEGDEIFLGEEKTPVRLFTEENKKYLEFPTGFSVRELMYKEGAAPLPPYIRRKEPRKEDLDRYQTIFAQKEGAIAAPTASLHFTESIFKKLRERKVEIHSLTLHVGLGTFKPILSEQIKDHEMQTEYYELAPSVIDAIYKAKKEGRPVTAVGTTVVRALESYFQNPPVSPFTNLFITPGYKFKIIDRFLTNFHQPCSTPLLLTSAFAGKDFLFRAYAQAIQKKYRLFSYGDCMWVV